jgi:hypothetical protein
MFTVCAYFCYSCWQEENGLDVLTGIPLGSIKACQDRFGKTL